VSAPDARGFVLVLDAGTTGIKAFVFDGKGRVRAKVYQRIAKHTPRRGWVEQDPMEILRVSRSLLRRAVRQARVRLREVRGVGITNQREATIVWEPETGKPVYPVIGWEDTRTRALCARLSRQAGDTVRRLTGLTIDSYFSATKLRWIFDHTHTKDLRFGTMDTWLAWNLCKGRPHVTDETNASRTLLFDIRAKRWSRELIRLFGVNDASLPRVLPSRAWFGLLKKEVIGRPVPLLALCGDQQASTYAALRSQPASRRSVTKVTYGTGVFVVQAAGKRFFLRDGFFTTLVPALGKGSAYALEAKIEKSGERVDRLLDDRPKLAAYFKSLSSQVRRIVKRLPAAPKELVVDGGIVRDSELAAIQQQTLGLSVCVQPTFDGTALGCALLIWDMLTSSSTPSHTTVRSSRTRGR